jgi:hypothetical protein
MKLHLYWPFTPPGAILYFALLPTLFLGTWSRVQNFPHWQKGEERCGGRGKMGTFKGENLGTAIFMIGDVSRDVFAQRIYMKFLFISPFGNFAENIRVPIHENLYSSAPLVATRLWFESPKDLVGEPDINIETLFAAAHKFDFKVEARTVI